MAGIVSTHVAEGPQTPDCSAHPPGVIFVLWPVRIKRNRTACTSSTKSEAGAKYPLARIHRRYDVTAAEWAIGAREGDGAGTISGKWGQCLSSAAAGRPCDRLGTLGRARWRGEDAARDSRGAGWRELAGTFGCPLGGSGTGVAVRQEVESLAVGPGRG